jgi:hypothetical protein
MALAFNGFGLEMALAFNGFGLGGSRVPVAPNMN